MMIVWHYGVGEPAWQPASVAWNRTVTIDAVVVGTHSVVLVTAEGLQTPAFGSEQLQHASLESEQLVR